MRRLLEIIRFKVRSKMKYVSAEGEEVLGCICAHAALLAAAF